MEKFEQKVEQGTGKTIIQLEEHFGGHFFLCNASDDEPITGEVHYMWDDFNDCPGICIPSLESFINLPET